MSRITIVVDKWGYIGVEESDQEHLSVHDEDEYLAVGIVADTKYTVDEEPLEDCIEFSKYNEASYWVGYKTAGGELGLCRKWVKHYFGHCPATLYVKEVSWQYV